MTSLFREGAAAKGNFDMAVSYDYVHFNYVCFGLHRSTLSDPLPCFGGVLQLA